jgi:hypothetical protein
MVRENGEGVEESMRCFQAWDSCSVRTVAGRSVLIMLVVDRVCTKVLSSPRLGQGMNYTLSIMASRPEYCVHDHLSDLPSQRPPISSRYLLMVSNSVFPVLTKYLILPTSVTSLCFSNSPLAYAPSSVRCPEPLGSACRARKIVR